MVCHLPDANGSIYSDYTAAGWVANFFQPTSQIRPLAGQLALFVPIVTIDLPNLGSKPRFKLVRLNGSYLFSGQFSLEIL